MFFKTCYITGFNGWGFFIFRLHESKFLKSPFKYLLSSNLVIRCHAVLFSVAFRTSATFVKIYLELPWPKNRDYTVQKLVTVLLCTNEWSFLLHCNEQKPTHCQLMYPHDCIRRGPHVIVRAEDMKNLVSNAEKYQYCMYVWHIWILCCCGWRW